MVKEIIHTGDIIMNRISIDFFNKYEQQTGIQLNDVQKQAIQFGNGPLLLLATPGSGKTTTLVMRIGYLVEVKGIPPEKVIALTFSKAQAIDLEKRFRGIFPTYQSVTFSTIHRLAFQVVRHYYAKNNISFQLIEGRVEPAYLHKRMIIRNLFEQIHSEKMTEDQVEEFSSYVSYVKNKRLKDDELQRVETNIPKATELYLQYEQFKQSHLGKQLLDFDDMLTKAHDILQNDPLLRESYRNQFDYVLVDESQDTSLIQYALIEKLSERHNNLCIVADDDQSIYSWRAAEPAYLLNLKDRYPEVKILKMEENYRSSKEIVETANQFIKRNKKRYQKEMFTSNGSVEQIKQTLLYDYKDQTKYVLDEVKKQIRFKDGAILFRNNFSAIPFVDALTREGIPFVMQGHDERFFSHWIVNDILDILRLSYDPSRVDILSRIYTKFSVFIDKRALENLQRSSNGESVFIQLAENTTKDYEKKAFYNIDKYLKELKELPPVQAIRKIRYELGYYDHLQKVSQRLGFNFEALLERLFTLEVLAESEDTIVSFANRLHELERIIHESQMNKSEDAITLMTMHRSKGMEFIHVYMVDLVEGIIPAKTDETESLMEEAVRLFYVGMTRAKMHLHLFAYRQKFNRDTKESRFFKDIYKIMHSKEGLVLNNIPVVGEPKRKSRSNSVKDNPKSPDAIQERTELKVGLAIRHYVFGRGIISQVTEDLMLVQFERSEKQLHIDLSLEKGVLSRDDT